MSNLNWGKLVTQGRAKAPGVSWNKEEGLAVTSIAQETGKSMGEIAHYVREGILTVEEYLAAEAEGKIVNPFLRLSHKELLEKAKELEIQASPAATKEVLAEAVLKATEEAKAKPAPVKTTEIEGNEKEITKVGKEKVEEPKPVVKPKAKPKAVVKKTDKK